MTLRLVMLLFGVALLLLGWARNPASQFPRASHCPPASWHGWHVWVVGDSPLATATYGPHNAVFDVSVGSGDNAILQTYRAQLVSIETWMKLEEPRRCRLFDSVLERLGSRDAVTRAWCHRNEEIATAWSAAQQKRPKTVRCVCSAVRRGNPCELQLIRAGDDPRDDSNPFCEKMLRAHEQQQRTKPPQFPYDCTVGFPKVFRNTQPREEQPALVDERAERDDVIENTPTRRRNDAYHTQRLVESGAKVPCFEWRKDHVHYQFNCSAYEASPVVVLLRLLRDE
jgi:hypothetical protein